MLGSCQLLCGCNGSQAAVFGDKHEACLDKGVGFEDSGLGQTVSHHPVGEKKAWGGCLAASQVPSI